MRKTFRLLIALLALSVSSWATPTTITWDATDVASINVYSMDGSPATSVQRLKGITLTGTTSVSGDYAGFYTYEGNTSISESNGGTLTFSSALYQILSIVINYDDEHGGYGYAESPTQWTPLYATLSWTGSATHSVELANAHVGHITSIEFTVEAIPTTTVTWDQTDIETINLSCPDVNDVATSSAISGITASLTKTSSGSYAAYGQFSGREIWISDCGELTFTSSVGDIVGIIIFLLFVIKHGVKIREIFLIVRLRSRCPCLLPGYDHRGLISRHIEGKLLRVDLRDRVTVGIMILSGLQLAQPYLVHHIAFLRIRLDCHRRSLVGLARRKAGGSHGLIIGSLA